MSVSTKTQVSRLVRLLIFTLLAQLPLVLQNDTITWRNLVTLLVVPLAEVVWRFIQPATPDAITGSSSTPSATEAPPSA